MPLEGVFGASGGGGGGGVAEPPPPEGGEGGEGGGEGGLGFGFEFLWIKDSMGSTAFSGFGAWGH